MSEPPLISVVSPVYGCRDCLRKLVERTLSSLDAAELGWELILVDDRGPDQPWDLITELASVDERVRGIRLARNHGQHIAIWAGLAESRGEWIAIVDCDLQDDPNLIPALLDQALCESSEAIVVERGSWSDSGFRRISSTLFYKLVHFLAGVEITNIGNFGIYSRRMVNALLLYSEQEVFLPVMVKLTGLKTDEIQLDRSSREIGKSSYSIRRLISLSISIIVRFSDRPLKISAVVGLFFSMVSGVISGVLVIGWLSGSFTVEGWTSTILSMWFLSGLTMAVLGIHGLYLARVFDEVKARPRILVESRTFRDKNIRPKT